jgi:hypothetical protein
MTERLSINLTKNDKAALAKWAAMTGETMSSLVRQLLRQEFHRLGLMPMAGNQKRNIEQLPINQISDHNLELE